MLAVQGALAATGAAVFWFPMLVSSRPEYGEPYFASVAFSRLLFRLSTAGFLPGWPLFMVAAVLVCVAALHGARSGASARYLLLMGGAVALITAAGLASGTPEAVYGAQLVRLVGVVPLVIGGAAALAATAAVRTGAGREAVWLTAIALAALAAVRGVAGPLDVTRSAPAAPPILEAALAAAGRTDGRIWLDPVATARLSFLSGGSAQLAGSYSGREWSLLHGPLEYFLAGHGSARNRAAYLLAHAVGVLVVPSGLRPAIVDPRDGDTPTSWHTVASDDGLDVIAPPWRAAAAWALPASLRREVAVPDLRFRDVEGSYIRDDHVARLAAAAARGTDTPIRVRYPSGGAIAIEITSLETGRFLVVSENWDRHWQATAVGRRLTVERVGPNLLGVDVGDLSGAVVVNLTHTQPGSAPAGLAVSLVSLVVGAALTLTQGRAQAGKPLEGAIGKRKRY
jgi:hypothetical protein